MNEKLKREYIVDSDEEYLQPDPMNNILLMKPDLER